VVHRDLKMRNILLPSNGDHSSLKIVDFGLSKILGPDEKAYELCGTNGYIA
jgi:serine/threonine protein kinase